MKKIISMLAVVAMLSALFVAPVDAATVANPEIKVYAELYDGTDAPSNYKPGDYDVYKVSYSTAGVDSAVDKITALQIKFTIDDDTKIAEKSWAASKTSGAASQRDANGVKVANAAPTLMSKGYYAWTNVDGVDAYDWDTYPDGGTEETLPLIETLIYVTAGETVTFTYSTTQSKMIVNTYEDSNERTYTTALAYSVNGVAGNVLTLGGSATTQYTITFKTYDGNSVVEEQTVDEGDTITAPTAPTRTGFTFAYWSEAQDGAEATIGTASADKTYYAVYTQDPPAEEIINPVENKSEAQDIGTTALTDLQGNPVNEFKKNYGIAKFDTAITTGDKNYFVVATDDKAEEKQFAVDFSEIGVEAENANVSFFAIVKSATHKIVSVVLKAVAK